MVDPQSHVRLKHEIRERMRDDLGVLEQLRGEIRPLRSNVRRIHPRSTTAISLVGTDGGNNRLQFDPFLVQLIRVVDSSNNEHCLEAVTPTTDVNALSAKQFNSDGSGATPLGAMMKYLGTSSLPELSHMIRRNDRNQPTSPSWVQVYRELVEWATLFSLVTQRDFGTDTLIVYDGLLRSKVFAGDLFKKYLEGMNEGIERHGKRSRRKLYLVGVAKHSSVLARYRLAMALENILTADYPAFVEIPRDIEAKVYLWAEYARGADVEREGAEVNKQVGGKMFFVKFGNSPRDPIWPVDIFLPQIQEAPAVLGYLLADAINGFPVPFYPLCLQRAHEHAALVDFDFDILQDEVFEGIRGVLKEDATILDIFRLQDPDPAMARYE